MATTAESHLSIGCLIGTLIADITLACVVPAVAVAGAEEEDEEPEKEEEEDEEPEKKEVAVVMERGTANKG